MERADSKVVLVPLDGSELAETAIPIAQELARATGGRLHLVRCFHISEDYGIAGPPPVDTPKRSGGQHRLEEYRRCERYLEAVGDRLGKDVEIDHSVLHGDTVEMLTELATGLPADFVVMTTHGRGGIKRLVLGSVADAMLRRLEIPILIVPASTKDATRGGEPTAVARTQD